MSEATIHALRRQSLPLLWLEVTLFFGLSVRLGLAFGTLGEQVSVMWPATGVALAAMLLLGLRVAPGVFLGGLIAILSTEVPWHYAVLVSAGNLLESAVAVWALQRFTHFRPQLERVHDVLGFVGLGVLVGPIISASIGTVGVQYLLPAVEPIPWTAVWTRWYLGNAIGAMVVGPFLLAFLAPRRDSPRPLPEGTLPRQEHRVSSSRAVAEGCLALTVLAMLELWLLQWDVIGYSGYLTLPLLGVVIYRLGVRGAVSATLILTVLAIGGAAAGTGPFARPTFAGSFEVLWAFVGLMALVLLVVAAALEERRGAESMNQVFLQLGRELASTVSPHEAACVVVEAADQLIGWDAAFVSLMNEGGDAFYELAKFDEVGGKRVEFPENYGRSGEPGNTFLRVIREGSVFLELGDESQAEILGLKFTGNMARMSAVLMYVPLRQRGQRPIGVLSIQSYTPGAYTRQELRLLEALADFCGEAIDRSFAEARLRENEERLNRAILGVDLGVWDWNIATDIVVYNERWATMLGYTLEEVLARDHVWDTLVHPADKPRVDAALVEWIAGRTQRYDEEYRMLAKDGSYRWIQSSSRVVERDEKGRAIRATGVHKDIDARKRAADENAVLTRLATRLAAASGLDEMIRIVSEETFSLFAWDAHYFAIGGSGEYEELNTAAFFDTVDGVRHAYPTSAAPKLDVETPRLINRDPSTPSPTLVPFGNESRPSASLMHVPIRSGDTISGVVSVQSYTRDRYDESHLAALTRFSDLLAPALERAKAAEALRRSEERFRALLTASPDLMFRIGSDGRYRDVQASRPNLLMAPIERYRGSTVRDILPEPLAEVYERVIRAALEQRTTQTVEYFSPGPAWGHGGHREARVVPSGDDEVIFIVRDITDRVEGERALRESEELLRAITGQMPDALLMMDTADDGLPARVVLMNASARRLYGLETGGGYDLDPWVLMARGAPGWPIVTPAWLNEGTARHGESIHRRSDGTEMAVEYSVRPLRHEGATLLLALVRDVTERRRAAEERQRLESKITAAQKLESLTVLAGGVAHDFNNLLVGILGNAGLALMELPPGSPAEPIVQQIETTALRASELTRQMLAYSGRGRFVTGTIDLSELVEEMAKLLGVTLRRKAILTLDLPKGLPPLQGDPTQIRQIVMNLITNASDALDEEGGDIRVACGQMHADRAYLDQCLLTDQLAEGRFVWVEVSDTGCGMDEGTRARIFDPFFSTKFPGRGLGLAAVLGIVRSHGGTLRVWSQPGQGTTFRVLFPPTVQDVAPSPAKETSPALSAVPSGRAILLADDDDTVRSVTAMMLERLGYRVLQACDGRDAVELLQRQPVGGIDVALLDVTMPNMGGVEAVAELRRIDPKLKCVLMSGFAEVEMGGACDDLQAFLHKPFRPDELAGTLERVLAG